MSRVDQPIGPDGLTGGDRDIIREVLARYPDVRRATLFGSRAMGTFGQGADIDLALEGPDLTPRTLARIAADLEDSDLPYKVDLLLWDRRLDPKLEEHIRRHGKPFGWISTIQPTDLFHPLLPPYWDRVPLYSLATWVNGLAFRNINFSVTGLPVIKIAEIKGGISGQTKYTKETFDDSVRVTAGDLLFSWSGQPETSIDAFWWRGPEGWLNQHVFRVTPRDGVDADFLYYLLRYLNPNFVAIARNKQTTGLGHVTKRDLQRIEAAYPEPNEQRAIAGVLGALDDKIEQNRRTARALERLARAIFRAWFVDFEPVKAKAEGATSFPSMPQPVFDALPTRFVDSEIGPVPEGWEVGTLANLSALNPEVWSKQTRPDEISYVDLSNTKWGRIDTVTKYQAAHAPSRAQRVLRMGDTIVGTVRPGNGSYALISEDGLTGSTGFAVLRPVRREYTEFVYLAATARENIEALSHLADGGAYPAVRPEIVGATQVLRLSDEVLRAFSRLVGLMLAKMAESERESRKLAAMRDYLLPKLLSGAVRVKDAEG